MKEIAKEIEGIWTRYKSLARKRQDTEAVLQCALADPAADLAALREALQAIAGCAKCSESEQAWKSEHLPQIVDGWIDHARAALARSGKEEA